MPVSFNDLRNAFEFVSFGGMGGHEAFLCKATGQIYWHSEFDEEFDELPDGIEDESKYLAIPDRRELGLGKPLALDFANQFLPKDVDQVELIFSGRGAYARFKDLLKRKGALDQWYEFEAKAEDRELRAWCELHGIELSE